MGLVSSELQRSDWEFIFLGFNLLFETAFFDSVLLPVQQETLQT